MKTMKPTQLRNNLYQVLDEIVRTGEPIFVERGGNTIKISVDRPYVNDLSRLVKRPELIVGNPDDIDTINWENEVNLDIP